MKIIIEDVALFFSSKNSVYSIIIKNCGNSFARFVNLKFKMLKKIQINNKNFQFVDLENNFPLNESENTYCVYVVISLHDGLRTIKTTT